VGLAAALGGDEAGAEGVQRRIGQRAQNNKPAGFRLTGVFHPCEVRTVRHAAFPGKSHGRDAGCSHGGPQAAAQVPCCVV